MAGSKGFDRSDAAGQKNGRFMRIWAWMGWRGVLLLGVMAGLIGGLSCGHGPTSTSKEGGSAGKWDAYVEQFLNEYFTRHPDTGVWHGRHEFDGLIPDWSVAGLRRESEWLK